MSAQRTRTVEGLLTIEEFGRLPDEGNRLELVRGRLVREPPPGGQHGWFTSELFWRLESYTREHGLGRTLNETGFLLSDDPPTVRMPDIAFLAREHLPSQGVPRGFWTIPPDLVVEVISPSNTAAGIQEKVLEYLEAGTRLVWVVDPDTRSVTSYRSRKDVRVLTDQDTLDGIDVLPGFRLGISDLFNS